MSLRFFLTSLVIVLIPGTGVVYTITTGLTNSRKNVLAAALGCTFGIVPHILASILGLSFVMNTSAKIFSVIRLAGACYLMYLAFMTWKNAGKMDLDNKKAEKKSFIQTATKAIVINLLNPKLTIFFFSFLPQFIQEDQNATISMLVLSVVFMLMTFVAFLCYGFLASVIKKIILRKRSIMKYVERSFAGVFAFLALKLAFDKE